MPNHALTLKEAQKQYSVNEATLRRACWNGRLQAQKRGGAWWVKRKDLEEWLTKFKPKPRSR